MKIKKVKDTPVASKQDYPARQSRKGMGQQPVKAPEAFKKTVKKSNKSKY